MTRMLTEMVQYSHKMKEEVKATESEIKQNIQGTNSEGKETRTLTNNLELKEEINTQPEQKEAIITQKMRRGLEISGTILNIPTSES